MKRKLLLALALLLLVLVSWLIWIGKSQPDVAGTPKSRPTKSEQPVPGTSEKNQPRTRPESSEKTPFSDLSQEEQFGIVFGASIKFYGKVIDQEGVPVQGAKVKIGAADRFWADGTDYFRESDAEGLFSIQGIKGAGIYVSAEKEGYYRTEKSNGRFGYGMPSGQEPHDEPDDPAIFVLHKQGQCEPLIYWEIPKTTYGRSWVQVPNGGSISVDLKSGDIGRNTPHSILISQSNTKVERENARNPYDWNFEVKVPGGGILLKEGKFNFQAPENGYAETFSKSFSKEEEEWADSFIKEYFIRFADGTYARVHLDMSTHQFIIRSSYLNPSGSRNLEYDPSKRIK